MKLFRARITCKLKAAYLPADVPADTILDFSHAIAALDMPGAAAILQSTFPWSFYKHVHVQWVVISEKA
jgi:hypothetical protein